MKNIVKDKNLHVGEIYSNKYGTQYKIIEYTGDGKVKICFLDKYKYVKEVEYKRAKMGKTHNPYDKTVYGVGAIGKTVTKINGVFKESYKSWKRMLTRCYDEKHSFKYKTYKNCYVCNEWLVYENFEKWFDKNYYKISNQIMEIDKDILIKHNKIYSPDTSIIVPHEINYLFLRREYRRGSYPIGVCYHSRDNKYTASCSIIIEKIIVNAYI